MTMGDMPRILITNDDGIESPGLRAVAGALSDAGRYEVIVAAPAQDMSGTGTSIGRFDPDGGVAMIPVDIPEAETAFSVAGPPGLAVTAAALGAFGQLPDLVVSGVNAGINTGHSIIHSGTVGAALTARSFHIKAMAVSLAQSDPWHWETAAAVGTSAVAWILEHGSSPHVLNVNVPALPIDEVKGTHWADLDDFGYFRVATAQVEDRRLQFVVGDRESTSDPSTDTILCSTGYVTITPLSTVEPAAFPDIAASSVWAPSEVA
jgi:5'-nucleotidase